MAQCWRDSFDIPRQVRDSRWERSGRSGGGGGGGRDWSTEERLRESNGVTEGTCLLVYFVTAFLRQITACLLISLSDSCPERVIVRIWKIKPAIWHFRNPYTINYTGYLKALKLDESPTAESAHADKSSRKWNGKTSELKISLQGLTNHTATWHIMHVSPIASNEFTGLLIGGGNHQQYWSPVDRILQAAHTFLIPIIICSCSHAPRCTWMICVQIRYQTAGRKVKAAAPIAPPSFHPPPPPPFFLPTQTPHPTCLGDRKCGSELTHATPGTHTGNLSCQSARESPG